MSIFHGRVADLERLRAQLVRVKHHNEGVLLSVRGRRQVGKSTLVEEFARRAGVRFAFFTATRHAPSHSELESFSECVAGSSLQAATLFEATRPNSWVSALEVVSACTTEPSILIIDELPYLIENDAAIEGVLQTTWDRNLSRAPLLLVLVGSDLSTMAALGSYDRPLYQRVREVVVEPFTVKEVASILGVDAAAAFEAYVILGGFPRLVREWERGETVERFLSRQFEDSTSPLVVVGERILQAEFPAELQAGLVLRTIGSGAVRFERISQRSGIHSGSLSRSLHTLVDQKRVLAVDRPLSNKASKLSLYRIDDPYLRFWLRFVGPALPLILRGQGLAVARQLQQHWQDYLGRAVDPLVRRQLASLLPMDALGKAIHVGQYWSRQGDVEVDVVCAHDDHSPTPVSAIGSIKWRSQAPFDSDDLRHLSNARAQVPGAESAALVGISRSGFKCSPLDVQLEPQDLLLE